MNKVHEWRVVDECSDLISRTHKGCISSVLLKCKLPKKCILILRFVRGVAASVQDKPMPERAGVIFCGRASWVR